MSRRSPLLLAILLASPAARSQTQLRCEGGPGPSTFSVAYDEARAELVVLASDDTWVHDGNRWQRRPSPTTLRNRTEAILAFDEVSRHVVLFGGRVGTAGVGETWQWDGANWTLLDNDPNLASDLGFMTFDTGRGHLVRQGRDQFDILRTWEWDGAHWNQIGNGIGNMTGLACDRAAGELYALVYSSLYRFSGAAWTLVRANAVSQSGYHHLAWDRARQVLVAFSHAGTTVQVSQWNGTVFAAVPTTSAPPSRSQSQPVFDTSLQRLVLHGGFDDFASRQLMDTWDWDGTQWSLRESPPALRQLQNAYDNVAYDRARDRVVVFQTNQYGTNEAGVREWDGRAWQRGPSQPMPTGAGPLVYDSLRHRIVLTTSASGPNVLTYAYDGSGWTQLVTAHAPTDRPGHDAAYDEAHDRVVLYGGGVFPNSETWLFDGTDWQLATPATSPPLAAGHRLAYDAVRQQVVMFLTNAQTWIWDGVNWSQHATPAGLSTRIGFAMAWDPTRQCVALTGGANPLYQPTGYTLRPAAYWEWNGTTWTQRALATLPQTLSASLVATARGMQLMLGGQPIGTDAILHLADPPTAAAATFGTGCPGTYGVPVLDGDFVPYLGHTQFALRLSSLPPQTLAVLPFALAAANVSLGNGCFQHVSGPLAVQVAVTDAGGAARFPLAIPVAPSFLGVRIWGQGAGLDPNGAFQGIAISPGIDLTLGN
ncbi:MAG: hypothetical protein U1E73_05925 [Planctomycetota bacterium]